MQYAHRFAPAGPAEEYVFGACCPGWHSAGDHDTSVSDWIAFMQDRDVERVCCLIAGSRLEQAGANLDRYREAFGDEHVRHVPVRDYHLLDAETLRADVLPFLQESRTRDQRVVVHCLDGLGRTGQVLAAWLVWGRGYGVQEALETVGEMGRDPMESVRQDNATRQDLLDVLGVLA